ncbi:hypothetical protein FOCC_FOCC011055 [Frankliniella occidentalis]|nr:hypothetical protein FOCC_FOCC011055 [Frankliniella occidentalis]
MVFSCTICNDEFQSISALCQHIGMVHPNKEYGTLLLLRRHLIKKHTVNEQNVNNHEGNNDNEVDNMEFENDPQQNFENLQAHVHEPVDNEISVPDFKLALYNSSLALSAKLYSVPSINRSRVQSILDICSDFSCSAHLEVLESKVNRMLRNYDGPQQDLHDLREMFISMRDSFEGLRTERQRIIALKQSNVYFPPKSFFIGRDWIMKKVNGVRNRVLVELTGQYICMKSILKYFFELPEMFTSTMENIDKLKRSNEFSNFIQGDLWKNIEDTHFQGRLVFPIILYFDDAEPNNQTGSHSGDHSLGLVYYFIPCIPQHLLSLLENLFVAAVFLTNDKRRRNDETFRIFFDFGFDSGNRVVKITMEHLRKEKLKMSSSEMYFFVRHLGLMIGDLVPEGDVVWRLYVLLTEIMDIVLSPTVRREAIPYLTTLISEHHQVYLNVSGKLLKPKFHFMTHTGRVMQQVGPLVNLWCMRLEGKHRPVVKAPANSHSCRKNMPLSTAVRYSFSLAARFLGMEVKPTVVFHFKSLVLREVDDFNQFQFIVPNNYYDASCVEMVTICGTMYKKNMVLAFSYDEDYPCFGLIFWIVKPFANDDQFKSFFIVRGLSTIGFNSHLHSYEVEHTNEWFFIEYHDLISFYPSECRTGADGLCYVNYRHAL